MFGFCVLFVLMFVLCLSRCSCSGRCLCTCFSLSNCFVTVGVVCVGVLFV